MRLVCQWGPWSAWVTYHDHVMHKPYQSRRRELRCGRVSVARLVEDSRTGWDIAADRKRSRFYMYGPNEARTVRGDSLFKTVRTYIKLNLRVR